MHGRPEKTAARGGRKPLPRRGLRPVRERYDRTQVILRDHEVKIVAGNRQGKKDFINRIERLTMVRVVRDSLVHIIPVLIIGAFALIVQTFPVGAYQNAISRLAGGAILTLAELIYSATFGVLSVYMAYSVSRSYMRLKADPEANAGGAIIASLLSFFILVGAYLPDFGLDSLGPKSMFLSIITGLLASMLYRKLEGFFRKHRNNLYSSGADRHFNRMLSMLPPIALVALVFAFVNLLIMDLFHMDSFRMLLSHAFNALFSIGEADFIKGFLFVLLSSVLWFFGIHGSDTLEGVMQTYFTPGLAANQAALAAGRLPETILTKEFFDCFVLIGGCGSAICLLIAILLFSKNSARRGLGLAATFPMIFNINELMVFGLPIIYNPIMLIPFLLTPLVCYSVAYAAIAVGAVPMITHEVAWTTPIILGGFTATGSVNGAVLQVVNVVIGVLIYLPFVRMLDRRTEREKHEQYDAFLAYYRENEKELETVHLTGLQTVYGEFSRGLCADLRQGMRQQAVLYYQPQYRYDGACIGVEALLRWDHPLHGIVYPPLVIKLADEGGFLAELEEIILARALEDRPAILRRFGEDIKLSVNVTGKTVVTQRYLQYCRKLDQKEHFRNKNLCLEVTEQVALTFSEDTLTALRSLNDLGLMLAIDDFSMGQTSLNYLKNSLFDFIKLDGSLVRGVLSQQNCREIIQSITQLAEALHLTVLAEYVETEGQKEILHEIGCDCYQGYLYSPAVPLEAADRTEAKG